MLNQESALSTWRHGALRHYGGKLVEAYENTVAENAPKTATEVDGSGNEGKFDVPVMSVEEAKDEWLSDNPIPPKVCLSSHETTSGIWATQTEAPGLRIQRGRGRARLMDAVAFWRVRLHVKLWRGLWQGRFTMT